MYLTKKKQLKSVRRAKRVARANRINQAQNYEKAPHARQTRKTQIPSPGKSITHFR